MAIALVGSPPPPKPIERVSGDNSTFASSIGNWTASGGTFVRDTITHMVNFAASGKFTPGGAGQHIDLALPGIFEKGKSYWAVVLAVSDAGTPYNTGTLNLGLIGTDTNSQTSWQVQGHTGLDFVAFAANWIPTANRSGVSLRITVTGTTPLYIGYVRVVESPGVPLFGPTNDGTLYVPEMVGSGGLYLGPHTRPGFSPSPMNETFYESNDGLSGYDATKNGTAFVFAQSPNVGDLIDEAFNLEVGADYVGYYASEKNSTTMQLYPDFNGNMVELRDRSTGGWSHSPDGVISGKISDSFQWAFYVNGAQTVGTNKAVVFQTPAKVIVEEVRIHLGTAPTGSTFIVDVNAAGTTIFTTQSRRPTIAISGTDATSGVPDGGTAIAKDTAITIDVDQIGSTIAGSDLVVFVRGRLIW